MLFYKAFLWLGGSAHIQNELGEEPHFKGNFASQIAGILLCQLCSWLLEFLLLILVSIKGLGIIFLYKSIGLFIDIGGVY
jgi:hypothetical protein